MTTDQRQNLAAFLQQLADWLKDGAELQQETKGKWEYLPPSFFDPLDWWIGRICVKPMERWAVVLRTGTVYCDTEDAAAMCINANRADWLRTVHLREVQPA